MSIDKTKPLTVLLDDARDFKDGRPAHVVRTSSDALALLVSLDGRPIDDLWLDYDLIGDDTSQPVVDQLVALAAAGAPLEVARFLVHSSNIRHGHRICAELSKAGYPSHGEVRRRTCGFGPRGGGSPGPTLCHVWLQVVRTSSRACLTDHTHAYGTEFRGSERRERGARSFAVASIQTPSPKRISNNSAPTLGLALWD